MGGAPEHPVWYLNLLADPEVTLQDKAVRRRYLAHTATGAEREEWWARAAAVWPDYDELPDQDGPGDPGRRCSSRFPTTRARGRRTR